MAAGLARPQLFASPDNFNYNPGHMGFFDRIFGRKPRQEFAPTLVPNDDIAETLSLQVLFPEPPRLDGESLTAALRGYHPSLAKALAELDPKFLAQGTPYGLLGWDKHVIRLVGFDVPMPAQAMEAIVEPAHYSPEQKAAARAHKAHVILYYAGHEQSPLEQYVALAAAAGALARFGAAFVCNEAAQTSLPIGVVADRFEGEDQMEALRNLPPAILYCGFMKMQIDDEPGVWMRTCGAHLLGLPDLALHTEAHDKGQNTFDGFNDILRYVQSSRAAFSEGNTLELGPDRLFKVRFPREDEPFLESEGDMLVLEPLSAADAGN